MLPLRLDTPLKDRKPPHAFANFCHGPVGAMAAERPPWYAPPPRERADQTAKGYAVLVPAQLYAQGRATVGLGLVWNQTNNGCCPSSHCSSKGSSLQGMVVQ